MLGGGIASDSLGHQRLLDPSSGAGQGAPNLELRGLISGLRSGGGQASVPRVSGVMVGMDSSCLIGSPPRSECCRAPIADWSL